MKYGVFHLFDYHPDLHGSEADVYRQLLEQSVQAEAWGYDAVWCAEHHFTRYGGVIPSPTIWGAAIARETRQIRIGLAVSLLPFHRPVRIAEDSAMLDILSHGRLEFGIGRGFLKWEYDNLGVPIEKSRLHFQEGLEVILKAWTTEAFDYEGALFQYRDLTVRPHPIQRPHPPIWVAATTTRETYRWAGEQGFNLMVVPFLYDLNNLEALVDLYRAGAQARGRPTPEVFGAFHIYVHEDHNRAIAEGEVCFRRYLAVNAEATGRGRVVAPPLAAGGQAAAPVADHAAAMQQLRQTPGAELVAQRRVLIGDPEHCAAMLVALQQRLGITHVGGQFNFGGMAHADVLRSMRLFREEVVPRVEAAALSEVGAVGDRRER